MDVRKLSEANILNTFIICGAVRIMTLIFFFILSVFLRFSIMNTSYFCARKNEPNIICCLKKKKKGAKMRCFPSGEQLKDGSFGRSSGRNPGKIKAQDNGVRRDAELGPLGSRGPVSTGVAGRGLGLREVPPAGDEAAAVTQPSLESWACFLDRVGSPDSRQGPRKLLLIPSSWPAFSWSPQKRSILGN